MEMISLKTLFLLSSFLTHYINSSSILDYSHSEGDLINIHVGHLTSIIRQIPYKYSKLHLCISNSITKEEDNLGEILSGEEIYSTNYQAKVNVNEYCKLLCNATINDTTHNTLMWMLNDNYESKWYLDKLPAGLSTFNIVSNVSAVDYFKNIPLGYIIESNGIKEYYIYNHFQFKVSIHSTDKKKYEVVGFTVLPISISQNTQLNCAMSNRDLLKNFRAEKQQVITGQSILFSYDVIFESSNITLASRWDKYIKSDKTIHLGGLISAYVVILITTLAVLFIFCRSLKKDIDIYNTKVINDEFIDEFGWKQVCNDVFRPCQYPILFSAFIGTGIQLYNMLFLTLLISVFGFMKPEKRGALVSLGLLLFVFMGLPGGFASAKMYRCFGGKEWLKTALLTAVMFPGLVFLGFIIVNILLAIEKSSAAVNFIDLLLLLVLWLCCSSPLVLIGSFFGIKQRAISFPIKPNPVPTAIPPKPWYFQSKFTLWIAGLLSFSTIFIEFGYIMNTLWYHQVYYLAFFLWMALLILIIVSGEISIIFIYVNLCKGDYNWWWKSFFFGGSSALYIIAYSVYFFFFTLNIKRLSAIIIYFGLMAFISSVLFLICGALATTITLIFLTKIYSMIKID